MAYIPSQTTGLQVLDRVTYPAGMTIFREGETGNRAYILQRGAVEFFKRVNGDDVLVGRVGEGSIFGEMALIDNAPRMASAVASDHCVCIIVSEVLFHKKMDALDPFLAGVLRVLVENIRSIQDTKLERHEIDAMLDAKPPVVEIRDDGDDAVEVA
jgi:CRP-like cAMP-binding protein